MTLPRGLSVRVVVVASVTLLVGAGGAMGVVASPLTDRGPAPPERTAQTEGTDVPGSTSSEPMVPRGFAHGVKKGWNGADVPPGWSHGVKDGWDGADVPPGWSHGVKKGWDGAEAPPGLSGATKKRPSKGRPPGWTQGVKKGWLGADVPPGRSHRAGSTSSRGKLDTPDAHEGNGHQHETKPGRGHDKGHDR